MIGTTIYLVHCFPAATSTLFLHFLSCLLLVSSPYIQTEFIGLLIQNFEMTRCERSGAA
jgi:hypothetical protein